MANDNSLHKQAGPEAHDGANLLRRITDAAPVGISYFDSNQRFCFANRSYEKLTGLSPDKLIGKTLEEAIGAGPYQVAGPYAERALKGDSVSFENTLSPQDGETIMIAASYTPNVGPDGAVLGFFALVEDVTERKRAEDALCEARDELEQRVEERTADLLKTNEKLETEIADRKRVEEALRESEKRYRDIFDESPVGILDDDWSDVKRMLDDLVASGVEDLRKYFNDNPGKLGEAYDLAKAVDISRATWELYGAPNKQVLIDWTLAETESNEELNGFLECMIAFMDGKAEFAFESSGHGYDGAPYVTSSRVVIPPQHRHDWSRVIYAIEDITERKRVEEALHDSEERLRDFAEAASDWFWEQDAELRFTSAPPEVYEKSGVEDADHVGKTRRDIVTLGVSEEQWDEHDADLAARRAFRDFTFQRRDPSGELRDFSISGKPVFDAAGRFKGYRGVGRDITEHKRAEEALRESEERFRAVVNNSPTKIHIKDIDGRYTLVNRVAEKLFGVTDEEARSKTSGEIFSHEIASAFAEHDQAVLETGRVVEQEEEWPGEDGVRTYLTVKFPIMDAGGRINAVGAIGTDITERKRTEEALRESEAHLQKVVDGVPALISYVDSDRRYVFTNKVYEKWFGVSPEETRGRYVWEVLGDDGYAELRGSIDQALSGKEVQFSKDFPMTKQGPMSVEGRLIPDVGDDGQVKGYFVFTTDITERKRTEEALRESEERVRAIVDNVADSVVTIDEEGRILSFNPAAELTFGYSPDEVIGKRVTILMEKSEHPRHEDSIGRYLRTGETRIIGKRAREVTGLRKDGLVVPLEIAINEMTLGGRRAFVAAMRDITERKQAEEALRMAKEHAELANRAKSEFLANMSHELRTPLNAIIGFSEMISTEILGAIENRKYLEYAADIGASGQHLLNLINDILDLSKIEAGKLELDEDEVDIAEIVDSCLTLVAQRAREGGVVVEVHISQDSPVIHGDARRLKQIVINLLANAVEFTPAGGRIAVGASIEASGELKLSVSDTGIGIAPDDLPYVMEVFGQVEDVFSREHQGSGLGLPLSKAMAELHGGSLDIESAPGVGTTVTLRLPANRIVSTPEASVG